MAIPDKITRKQVPGAISAGKFFFVMRKKLLPAELIFRLILKMYLDFIKISSDFLKFHENVVFQFY